MISGVSSYSSYAYSSASSMQRSAPSGGDCAGGPAKVQEKLFSLLKAVSIEPLGACFVEHSHELEVSFH